MDYGFACRAERHVLGVQLQIKQTHETGRDRERKSAKPHDVADAPPPGMSEKGECEDT